MTSGAHAHGPELGAQPAEIRQPDEGLGGRARIYFFCIAGLACAVVLPFVHRLSTTHAWRDFVVLSALAAGSQLFTVMSPRNQSYHTATVFLLAAILLLPPELIALMALVQHIPEWL